MNQELLIEVRNRVGFITLNRPAALNALSHGMIKGMYAQLRTWERDPAVLAVLVQGAGGKALCAGGDIVALYTSVKTGTSTQYDYFVDEYRLNHYTHIYSKPYVALMDGITMGGGMGIAQGSRYRLVGDRTRVAMPETGIGFFPDVGGSYFLSRLPGGLGMYLGLTGLHIRTADTLYSGLADAYLPPDAVAGLPESLSTLRWTNDAEEDIAALVNRLRKPFDSGATLPMLREAIDEHFATADVPAILDSLRRETRPQFHDWARDTLEVLGKRSPLMLLVTARQIQQGSDMSLADCLRMELVMVHRSVQEHDLAEGIRALLVDKDNSPRWEPARLEDVTPAQVDAFFKSPWTPATHPFADLNYSTSALPSPTRPRLV